MSSSGASDEVEVNLTPLLDLVLQLIMFFMITIRLVAYEQSNEEIYLPEISLSLPQEDEKKLDKFPVWINIDYKGDILGLGKEVLTVRFKDEEGMAPEGGEKGEKKGGDKRKELQDKIKDYFTERKKHFDREAPGMGLRDWKVGVVIRADRRCRYDYVWALMDIVQDANFDFWQISIVNLDS